MQSEFLVHKSYVAGSKMYHEEGDFIITGLFDNYSKFDV